MKHNISKLLLMAIIGSITLMSCGKEEESPKNTGPVYIDLVSYESNALGVQTNLNLGSFYSVMEDSIYFTSRANTKQSSVDLICYFNNQGVDSFVIAAPNDAIFNNVQDQNPHFSVKSWTEKNDTKFLKLNISQSVYNNMSNDSLLQSNLTDTTLNSSAKKLKIGDVYGFKLKSGKLGLFYVKAIDNTNALTRAVTIDVKVQKP